jgi:Coproporphyrinogen III oxidase and related Fe-S oxidoreductases
MKSKLLEKIFEYIYKKYKIKKNLEVCLEANPEDINYQKLKEYKDIGINRINLGVQSFSDNDLNFLGRNHNKEQALRSIWEASEYFSNIGIDLITGIPSLKKNSFNNQLIVATELPIKHISIYEFSYKNKEMEAFETSYSLKKYSEILKEKKFFLYEINSFSIRGYESTYNKSVLGMDNYIGLGPSAYSRL